MNDLRRFSILVTCEHASPALPEGADLGLSKARLESHISYDRGARTIAERVAAALEAPLHLGRYSRLWVDLNRREENPSTIAEVTYDVEVPGNVGISDDERRARIETVHRPYRAAARSDAVRLADAGGCLHLSMHAFDPSLDEEGRRFDVGVLFDPGRHPEATVAAALRGELEARGHRARLNEPYLGYPEGLTSWLREQLPEERYVGFEIEASYRADRPRLSRDLAEAARGLLASTDSRQTDPGR